MRTGILQSLRWSISLGAKIGRVVPWLTIGVVVIALISQIAMLLASFLPLKVVILLGSEGIPHYLPSALHALGKDTLIGVLSLVTVAFYITHLAAEKLVALVTERAVVVLLKSSHKLVLFERQDEVAATAYQRFSRALAGGVFSIVAIVGLSWVYVDMAMVIVGYISFCTMAILVGGSVSQPFRQLLEEKLGPTLSLVAGAGFFVCFGFLVLDFIILPPPGVMPAIVSLLLTRMVLLKVRNGVVDIVSIVRQRAKLDALFFHGKVFLPPVNSVEHDFWSLIQPASRELWVKELFQERLDCCAVQQVEWHQSGVPNVAALVVRGAKGIDYLVKIFDSSRRGLALHEATLTGESIKLLPAPKLILNTQVRQFQCLIYDFPHGQRPERDEVKSLLEPIRGRLMWVEPPPALILQYTRSRPMLWQRLSSLMLERLHTCASSDKERYLAGCLSERLSELKDHLRKMPLVFINSETSFSNILLVGSEIFLLGWGRWALDPIGSGWRDAETQIDQLGGFLAKAIQRRPALRGTSVLSVELAALVFSFESKCARQLFAEAFELLPRILDRLDLVLGRHIEPVSGGQ